MSLVNKNVDSETDDEKSRIEVMMAETQSELLAAENAARRLRQKQYDLKTLMNETTSIMSSLPRETVSEIFSALCASMHLQDIDEDASAIRAPFPVQFLIGRVCKGWREIAWATPRLWRKIFIWFSEERYKTQKRLLEEWIKRSGSCSLDLTLRLSKPPQFLFGRLPWHPPVDDFRSLLQSCHRWETLDSVAFQTLVFAFNEQEKSPEFSVLRTVKFHDYNGIRLDPVRKWRFDYAPLLQDLNIRAVLPERCLAVNWNSLTRLSTDIGLTSPGDDAIRCISMSALASCHSLSSLKCEIRQNSDSQIFDEIFCYLPYLEDMELAGMDTCVAFFLEQTSAPALKRLDLSIDASSDELPWTHALLHLAGRSSFKLEVLKLHCEGEGRSGDDAHIAFMLGQLSRSNPIKELVLTYAPIEEDLTFSDSMIKLLTIGEVDGKQEKQHFPVLSHFFFQGNVSFNVYTMSRMLESRLKYEVMMSGPKKESVIAYDNFHKSNKHSGAQDSLVDSGGHIPVAEHSLPATGPSITIIYSNVAWFRRQHPNMMRSFYQDIEAFATGGRSFCLHWVPHEAPSLDQDEASQDSE